MQRTLSSAWTFFYKIIFPVLWISGFGLATITVYLTSGNFRGNGGALPPAAMKRLFLGAWLLGSGIIYWFCVRLKRVRINDEALYVSNYRQEVRVPLRDVAEVSENRWVNIHPVTITFQCETAFGRSIVFMPKVRWAFGWSSHPVVAELRAAARRAASV